MNSPMTLDEFFAEAKRLKLRVLGTPDDVRAALDAKDAEILRLRGIVPEVLERLNDELCEENERLRAEVAAERERAEALRQALLKCKTCALPTEVRELVNAALRAERLGEARVEAARRNRSGTCCFQSRARRTTFELTG